MRRKNITRIFAWIMAGAMGVSLLPAYNISASKLLGNTVEYYAEDDYSDSGEYNAKDGSSDSGEYNAKDGSSDSSEYYEDIDTADEDIVNDRAVDDEGITDVKTGDVKAGGEDIVNDRTVEGEGITDIKAGDVKAGDIKAGNMKSGDMKTGNMKAGGEEAGNAKTDDSESDGYDNSNAEDVISEDEINTLMEPQEIQTTGTVTGSCGANIDFSLNLDTGKLSITGTGAMNDYEKAKECPFYIYADRIRSVEIGEGITKIGKSAFIFAYGLESVKLPSTLTEIGQYAFLGCRSLTRLAIPGSVTTVGDYSIGYYCDNGKEGSFVPMSMKWVTNSQALKDYKDNENNKERLTGIEIYDSDNVTGSLGDNITWSYNILTRVLRINGTGEIPANGGDNYASYGKYETDAKKIVIGSGITSISDYAFSSCGNLTELEISEGLTSIGNFAFYDSMLIKVSLPDSLTTIGSAAFNNCKNLETVNIPAKVTSIGDGAFRYTYSLNSITVDSENEKFTSLDGILCDKGCTRIIQIPPALERETVVIPESIKYMSDYQLEYCKMVKRFVFEGDAPSGYSARSDERLESEIYYNSSRSGWDAFIKKFTSASAVDYKDMKGVDTLSLSAPDRRIASGDIIKLSAVIDPAKVPSVTWESSNEKVAVINSDGKLFALSPGTTVITAKGGGQTAQLSINVTGQVYAEPKYSLSDFKGDFTTSLYKKRQYISDRMKGIYIVGESEMGLYSLITGNYERICGYCSIKGSNVAGNLLYISYVDNNSYYRNGGYVDVIDMDKCEVISHFAVHGYSIGSVGADNKGNIYVSAKNEDSGVSWLLLFDSDGNVLDKLPLGFSINDLSCTSNGGEYFFAEAQSNYYAWGYNHWGVAAQMFRISGGRLAFMETYSGFLEGGMISRTIDGIDYLYQSLYNDHVKSIEVFGDKYMVDYTSFMGTVNVYKPDSWDSYSLPKSLSVELDEADTGSTSNSVGVRAMYNPLRESMIIYDKDKTLTEYSIETGDKLSECSTAYKVFSILKLGDDLVLVEKDGDNYYLEMIYWGNPKSMEVSGNSTINVGECGGVSLKLDTRYSLYPEWTSSDNKILSVTGGGKISAWKPGNVTVTAKLSDGRSTSIDITVLDGGIVTPAVNVKVTGGAASSANISYNNYLVWAGVVGSYLTENSDGSLSRVEYKNGTGVVVENYDKNYNLLSSKVIPAELILFGGFYSGRNANYIVFGQNNEAESDDCEIMRVVKYDKAWNRLSQTSVKGANTYIPFDAGSLRMDETEGGLLYVHTCHEMYLSSDGLHHQANMTYVINEADMQLKDSYYNVMNIAQAGYVSHSFNQFVKTDGTYTYRVDHGDANPRAVTLTRCDVDGKITNVIYCCPLSINVGDWRYNATGVSVGGFELSSENCIVAANSVDQSGDSVSGTRNIYLSFTSKDLTKAHHMWLTDYAGDSGITVGTPQLVKLNDEQFMVLWEETRYNSSTGGTGYVSDADLAGTTVCKMVTIDGDGNMTSDIVTTNLRLSDCNPIVGADKLVRWYVTDDSNINFCTVNPYDLASVKGAVTVSTKNNRGVGGANGDHYNDSISSSSTVIMPGGSSVEADYYRSGSYIYDNNDNAIYKIKGGSKLTYVGGAYAGGAVVIPDSIVIDNKTYKVTVIEAGTFKNNKNITSVQIGNNVTAIGKATFSGCSNLKKVTIGKAVKSVGASAFANCKSLMAVTLGSGVETIASSAFANCTKLAAVTLDAKLKSIGDKAFYKCIALTKVTIPKNVTKIGKSAFEGCKKLKSIIIKTSKLKSVGKKAIKGIHKKAVIKVPKKKLKKYKKLFKSKTGFKKSMKIKK